MSDRPLWTVDAMAQAMRRASARAHCRPRVRRPFDRQAHDRAGRSVLRDHGRQPRRPRIRAGGARGRRRPCGGRGGPARGVRRRTRRCWSCPTCSMACAISRARRARARARKVIGVTGSVGKTGTKEALRLALAPQRRDPRLGRLLQQPLGRAALARALPASGALCGVRDGHEPCRRDRAADRAGAPACRDHHHGRAGASRILRLARGDRRRQGGDLRRHRAGRGGGAQPRQCAVRAAASERRARRRRAHRLLRRARRGRRAAAQVRRCSPIARRCRRASSAPTSPTSSARRAGISCSIRSRCWRRSSLAGADLALAALALAEIAAARSAAARA